VAALTADSPIGPILERLRVIALAGAGLGLLVGGIGGRLAMFLLRVTSPAFVDGRISDDGFEIGRFTLSGTYNLLGIGIGAGLVGAAVYLLVAPWLIGPVWFKRFTAALGAGIVVGAMLVHADGIDFTVLEPLWLAVGLFVAIPMLFGALIGPAVAWCRRPDSWVNTGNRRWIVPVAVLTFFPLSFILVGVIGLIMVLWAPVGSLLGSLRFASSGALRLAVRGMFLAIPVLALTQLIGTIRLLV